MQKLRNFYRRSEKSNSYWQLQWNQFLRNFFYYQHFQCEWFQSKLFFQIQTVFDGRNQTCWTRTSQCKFSMNFRNSRPTRLGTHFLWNNFLQKPHRLLQFAKFCGRPKWMVFYWRERLWKNSASPCLLIPFNQSLTSKQRIQKTPFCKFGYYSNVLKLRHWNSHSHSLLLSQNLSWPNFKVSGFQKKDQRKKTRRTTRKTSSRRSARTLQKLGGRTKTQAESPYQQKPSNNQ